MSMDGERQPDVTVVGLGPGPRDLLTPRGLAALERAEHIVVRTRQHASAHLLRDSARVSACDDLYESCPDLPAVYVAIVERVVAAARGGPVVYAVPGDPRMGEASVAELERRAAEAGLTLVSVPGISFVGPTLAALGWDAFDRLQIGDATELALLQHPPLDPDRPALVAQLYGVSVASDAKLTLLNQYPADHPVALVSGAGTSVERVRGLTLSDLDRTDDLDDTTTLALPAFGGDLERPTGPELDRRPVGASFYTFVELIARLRAPDGCPWDQEQTHASLRPYLLEEAYEVLEAIDDGEPSRLAEELGDLLLQVVLHSQIAAESGEFLQADVIWGISEKIYRRHPHVFGTTPAADSAEVRARWEDLKADERRSKGEAAGAFAGVPRELPALARAQAIRTRAERVGQEPDTGLDAGLTDPEAVVARRLWGLVTEAMDLGVDAESALRRLNEERIRHFEARVDTERQSS